MIPKDYALVQDSWEKLSANIDAVSKNFYARLFKLKPTLASKFSNPETQAKQFMSMLNIIVNGIEQLDLLKSSLTDLGMSHKKSNVSYTDIVCMEEALICAFRDALADDFNDDVEIAWREAYRTITKYMAIK